MAAAINYGRGRSRTKSRGISEGFSSGTSRGLSFSTNESRSFSNSQSETTGESDSETESASYSETDGVSTTNSTSKTRTLGTGSSSGTGTSQTLQRRPLFHPDEVGRAFPRIDDRNDPRYPGFALVLISGCNPFVVRRTPYYEDFQFIECFSPHPDHEFQPAFCHAVDGHQPYIRQLQAAMPEGERLTISQMFIRHDEVTFETCAMRIEHVPPYNKTVSIETPGPGKVAMFDTCDDEGLDFDGPLFLIKNYSEEPMRDALAPLKRACAELEEFQRRRQQRPVITIDAVPVLALPPAPAQKTRVQKHALPVNIWLWLIMAIGFALCFVLDWPSYLAYPVLVLLFVEAMRLIMILFFGDDFWTFQKQ